MNNRDKHFEQIYKDVFCNMFSQSCYVFLCGGADKTHIRNKVRTQLEKKNYQILYPEDLFMDMLNRNKRADLFDFENLLAENSDIICVICESMGSAVELGAFVQNEMIRGKMVAAIENKYARNKSFIMMGPIKYLKKQDKNRILFYKKEDIDIFIKELDEVFGKINRKKRKSSKNLSFDNLAAYIEFIPLVIWFFEQIDRKELFYALRNLLVKQGKLPNSFNELFNASIKYLLKERTIVTDYSSESGEEQYSLSDKGYNEVVRKLENINMYQKTKLQDKIRCDILMEQLK